MDKIAKNKSKFTREVVLMKDTMRINATGFPKLIYYISDKNYYYVVMEQLGLSLKDLKESVEDHKFTIKTTTMIAL